MTDYWVENDMEKPQQIIVCAACRVYGIVLCGARHWDSVMRQQYKVMSKPDDSKRNEEQGFINQFGEFLTREQSMKIVKENGQPFNIENNGGDVVLFSEGLY